MAWSWTDSTNALDGGRSTQSSNVHLSEGSFRAFRKHQVITTSGDRGNHRRIRVLSNGVGRSAGRQLTTKTTTLTKPLLGSFFASRAATSVVFRRPSLTHRFLRRGRNLKLEALESECDRDCLIKLRDDSTIHAADKCCLRNDHSKRLPSGGFVQTRDTSAARTQGSGLDDAESKTLIRSVAVLRERIFSDQCAGVKLVESFPATANRIGPQGLLAPSQLSPYTGIAAP